VKTLQRMTLSLRSASLPDFPRFVGTTLFLGLIGFGLMIFNHGCHSGDHDFEPMVVPPGLLPDHEELSSQAP
jgi:hypothetical protein